MLESDRPSAWGKVPLLQELLDEYGLVVWIDDATVVIDPKLDIADGTNAPTRLITHCADGWWIPNYLIMVLRKDEQKRALLGLVWAQVELIHHKR